MPPTTLTIEKLVPVDQRRWLVAASLLGAAAVGLTGLGIVVTAEKHDPVELISTEATVANPASLITLPFVAENIHASPVPAPRKTPDPRPKPNSIKLPITVAKPHPAAAPKPTLPPVVSKGVEYSALRRSLSSQIGRLPTLPEAARLFPSTESFQNVPAQLAYIEELSQMKITVEDYRNFKINTDYIHAFDGQKTYNHPRIDPKLFVQHWTARHYPGGVEELIRSMRSGGKRVLFFQDRDNNIVYQLFDAFDRYGQHAKGANLFTNGVENEATGMLDLTPKEHKTLVMLNVKYAELADRSISRSAIVGHYAVDLLFYNPTYDGKTGTFHPAQSRAPFIDKTDFPQEYIDVVVAQAQQLRRDLSKA